MTTAIVLSSCSKTDADDLYQPTRKWVRQFSVITKDVGEIIKIQPAGDRESRCAFTNGCSYQLTLQVIGANGVETVKLVNDFVDRTPPNRFYLTSVYWN